MARWQSLKADRRAWAEAVAPVTQDWDLPEMRWRAAVELYGADSAIALGEQIALIKARELLGDVTGALAMAQSMLDLLGHAHPLREQLNEVLLSLRERVQMASSRPLLSIAECESTGLICAARRDDERWEGWVSRFRDELDRGLRSRMRGVRLPPLDSTFAARASSSVEGSVSDEIDRLLAKTFALVLIAAPDTAESSWCQHEAAAFFRLHGASAIERLYIIALSQSAVRKVLSWPLWEQIGADTYSKWLQFFSDDHPEWPISISLDRGVLSPEFIGPFERLREHFVESIRRSLVTGDSGTSYAPERAASVATTTQTQTQLRIIEDKNPKASRRSFGTPMRFARLDDSMKPKSSCSKAIWTIWQSSMPW